MDLMIFKGKRFFTTKLTVLLKRRTMNNSYPYEFLRKMTKKEEKIFVNDVKKILKACDIPTNNINHYNRIFNAVVEEREDIYQQFKLIGHDNGVI